MAWPTTSRHERGYGTEWNKTRLRILARDKRLCQPCLRKGRVHVGNEVDHKLPKAKGCSVGTVGEQATAAKAIRGV